MQDAAFHFERAAAEAALLLEGREWVYVAGLQGILTHWEQCVSGFVECGAGGRDVERAWHREYVLPVRKLVRGFSDTHGPAIGLLRELGLPVTVGQGVRNRLLAKRVEVELAMERLGEKVQGEVVAGLQAVRERKRGTEWFAGRLGKWMESLAVEGRRCLLDGRMVYFRTLLRLMGEMERRIFFMFVGGVGEHTRPFCAVRVGWVFDLGEVMSWEKMAWSGRSGEVLECCGGEGCRHFLLPVSGVGIGGERFWSRLGKRVAGGTVAMGVATVGGYWDSGTVTGKWHDMAFGRSLEYVRRAVGLAGEPGGGIRNTPGEKRMMFCLQDKVPWIEMGGIGYHVGLLRLEKLVWRHEFGHYMDYFLNGFANCPFSFHDLALRRALIKDGGAIVMRAGLGGSRAYRMGVVARTNRVLHRLRVQMSGVAMGERKGWFDKELRRFGLTLQQVEGVLRADTLYGGLEREENRLLLLLTALERRDVLLFGEQVLEWRRRRHQEMGMSLTVGDYFGSMTGNKVGCGHEDGYYRERPVRRWSESFANGLVMLGDWNLFWTRLMQIMSPRFAARMMEVLKTLPHCRKPPVHGSKEKATVHVPYMVS